MCLKLGARCWKQGSQEQEIRKATTWGWLRHPELAADSSSRSRNSRRRSGISISNMSHSGRIPKHQSLGDKESLSKSSRKQELQEQQMQ